MIGDQFEAKRKQIQHGNQDERIIAAFDAFKFLKPFLPQFKHSDSRVRQAAEQICQTR